MEKIIKNIMIDKTYDSGDFVPLFSGEEVCSPSHSFGPFIRDYYIIHFCLSGKGRLTDKYGEHSIGQGELFIIREGESTIYTADSDDPWHYIWIAALGKRADELDSCPSVVKCEGDLFKRIKTVLDKNESRPEIYSAFLYEILYFAKERNTEHSSDRISEIKRYIKYNFMLKINVESIAELFGFERSYLYRIFKERYGIGVKEYLIKVRMEKARELLHCGHSVAGAAALTGYCDEFAFSKAYKKHFGISPVKTKFK